MANNIPNFQFTLISNAEHINSLGSVGTDWTNSGSGTSWANGSGKIEVIGGSSSAALKHQSIPILPGKRYTWLMFYTAINSCQIVISLDNTQSIYTFNAPASPAGKLLSFDFVGYANSFQIPTIKVIAITGTLNFSFALINVAQVDGLTRVIYPGKWKGLNKSLDRLIGYWGFLETIEGSLEIVGEDLQWMLALITTQPDKRFECLIEIENDAGAFEHYFRGLLDTVSLRSLGLGEEGSASRNYTVDVPFLKETEWSRFASYLDKPLDPFAQKAVNSFDVIDCRNLESIAPSIGLPPRLKYRYNGKMLPGQSFTLSASEIVYMGFADEEGTNDGFDTYAGISKVDTLRVPVGRIRQLVGTVQIYYSAPPQIVVEAILTDAGTYTTLVSGVVNNINLSTYYGSSGYSGFHVRLRNTAASSQVITFITNPSVLDITNAQIEFEPLPRAQMPLLYLKGYLARILGDYDNLSVPVFEDGWNTLQSDDTDIDLELQNPPPKGRPFNAPTGTSGPQIPMGNYYSGGTADWAKVSPGTVEVTSGGVPTNVLLMRLTSTLPSGPSFSDRFTSYATKGTLLMFIDVNTFSGTGLEIVGVLDHQIDVLHTTTITSVGLKTFSFSSQRYYEGIGIRLTTGNLKINGIGVSYLTTGAGHGIVRGAYALNYLSTGLGIKETVLNSFLTSNTKAQMRPFSDGLDGLLKIFGLGMEPRLSSGKVKMHILPHADFFESGTGIEVYAEDTDVTMDEQLVRDAVAVGGPARQERTIDQDSAASLSNYRSTFITTAVDHDLSFNICLNPALILNLELGNEELVLFELNQKPFPGDPGVVATFRTSDGLTITGSDSPQQPNWKHNESRIIRRNLTIISAMGSQYFTIIGGVSSTLVSVDASDGLGPIAGADPVFATPSFSPWLIIVNVAMNNAGYNAAFLNRFKRMLIHVGGSTKTAYIKSVKMNPAVGRGIIMAWLKAAGDFSDDFSDDFENESLPLEI